MNLTPSSRSLVKRNKSLYTCLQIACDNLIALAMLVLLCYQSYGYVPVHYQVFVILLISFMVIQYSYSKLYSMNASLIEKSILRAKLLVISFLFVIMIGFLTGGGELISKKILLNLFLSVYVLQVLSHILFLQLRVRFTGKYNNRTKSKAIIVGTDKLAIYLLNKINENPWLEQSVIGMVSTDVNVTEKNNIGEAPVLGGLENLDLIIKEHNITSVYFSVSLDSSSVINDIYCKLLNENINVYWAPNIFSLNLINHHISELAGIPIITLSESPFLGLNLMLKNLEDKILSLLLITLLFPLFLIISIIIKIDSPGPVFFRQQRTGWDGEIFHILKFRTMKFNCCDVDGSDNNVKQAVRDDTRFTKFGKFLRSTSLDELPQLFNVLKGSMSIIGPRPHAVVHNELYAKEINNYLSRHRIKPGITGLAQVRGFRGEITDIEEMEQRVQSDLEYINSWNITLDLVILLRTFIVIFKRNAY